MSNSRTPKESAIKPTSVPSETVVKPHADPLFFHRGRLPQNRPTDAPPLPPSPSTRNVRKTP